MKGLLRFWRVAHSVSQHLCMKMTGCFRISYYPIRGKRFLFTVFLEQLLCLFRILWLAVHRCHELTWKITFSKEAETTVSLDYDHDQIHVCFALEEWIRLSRIFSHVTCTIRNRRTAVVFPVKSWTPSCLQPIDQTCATQRLMTSCSIQPRKLGKWSRRNGKKTVLIFPRQADPK